MLTVNEVRKICPDDMIAEYVIKAFNHLNRVYKDKANFVFLNASKWEGWSGDDDDGMAQTLIHYKQNGVEKTQYIYAEDFQEKCNGDLMGGFSQIKDLPTKAILRIAKGFYIWNIKNNF